MSLIFQAVAERLYTMRLPILIGLQVSLIVLANQAAFWLRFDGVIPPEQQPYFRTLLPLLLLIRISVFIPFRLQKGVWRYASIVDLRNIVAAVAISTAVFWAVVHGIMGVTVYPRSVIIIDGLLLISLLGGVRLARRMFAASTRTGGRKVLIYGAGDAGEMLARDMRQNAGYDANVIGFIDDDRSKRGRQIHGIPVLGAHSHLEEVIRIHEPDEIVIAIPSAAPSALRAIVRQLQPYRIRISTLPRLSDLVGVPVGMRQVRQLKLDDLLARDAVNLDSGPVSRVIQGKCVMVTGAGGSIGAELCRQIAQLRPETLLLLDRYENGLFAIGTELAASGANLDVRSVVADITDERRIKQVLATWRPNVIFHAAAHKHVPLMEANPCEAVKNNIRGTRILGEAAAAQGVERFVLISTDKAVNPTSVMGAAKRVTELLVQSLDRSATTQFVVVRFGNVLGSNGSVVPRFVHQIESGGPVTVTDPGMRRFFMLIPEAVQLVLHAAAIDDRGAIFVLDMGEQVRVADMARHLIRLSGYIPDREIEIVYTGVRPGEKLFEELVSDGETAEPSGVPKINKVRSSPAPQPVLSQVLALEQTALNGDDNAVIEQLCQIVPSFTPTSRSIRKSPVVVGSID